MNRKLWWLFYAVIFTSTVVLSGAIYFKYQELVKSTSKEQVYITKSFYAHLNALFTQFEGLNNLVAEQYQQANFDANILNNIANQYPLVNNLAIFTEHKQLLEGDLALAAFTKTKQFVKAQNSEYLIIGETYFDHQSQHWLIPTYKKIASLPEDKVLISTLSLAMLNETWKEQFNNNTVQATLADGLTPIFRAQLPENKYASYYSQTVTAQDINLKAYLKSFHKKAQPHTKRAVINQRDVLFTVIYDQHYQYWVSADVPYSLIWDHLIYHSSFYTLLYLLFLGAVWAMIKWTITVEESKLAALTYEMDHDALTGLPNRNTLAQHFFEASESKMPFALLYFDLDKFKNINDSFGHSCGDNLLIEVGKRVNKAVKQYQGIAIRYSGDEFVCLINSDDKILLQHCAAHILDTVSQPYLIQQDAFRINASIGIACYPEDAQDVETLLSYADNSMSVAKQNQNQCAFFSKSAHYQLTRRVEIEQALHTAIQEKEISLVYQPQLNADNTLFGVEALVRWNSQELGVIAPDEFIPIAEEIGLMPKLGLFIMQQAIREISQLQELLDQHFSLSINVSVRQFIQIDFIEKLIELTQKYNYHKPLPITVEITESLFIENIDALMPLFHKLKHNRIILSLDDFGTGYSSLSLLRNVPIDELKIDKSFVADIATNNTDKGMVESIISMGKKLGLSVLAEGVETREQADILVNAGCDLFQGYFFARPLTIEQLKNYCIAEPIIDADKNLLLR